MRDLNVTSLPVHLRTVISSRLPYLVVAALSCGFGLERTAIAQPAGAHSAPPSSGPPMGSRPPRGMTPPMPAGMGPRQPGPAGGIPIPGSAVEPGKGPAQELKIDPNTLPPNFTPPAAKDKVMLIDQPLAMKDELDKLKKEIIKYQRSLSKGNLTDQDKQLIRGGIRYRLALMCQKENRQNLTKLHDELLRELNSAAQVPDNPTPVAIKAFRQFVLQELVTQATPLLSTQNFYVRLHLAILLGELELTKEDPRYAFKQEAFVVPCEALVDVITDPKQPEAVKIAAVNGLARILRLGSPNVALRTKVAGAIVSELKNNQSHPWYQMRLAGALSVVDIELDQTKQPFVVNVLKSVLADDTRTWSVRAEAAKSLGRVPLPAGSTPSSVPKAIAVFTLKLAKAAQQSPQQKPDDPKWRSEFFKVYLAFQPLDANDLMADKKSKAGLLNNKEASAATVYNLIVPLVSAILRAQRLTVKQLQDLEGHVGPLPANTQPAPPSNDSKTDPAVSNKAGSTSQVTLDVSGPKQD